MSRDFLLDLNKCTGCAACRLACEIENRLESGDSWRQVLTFNERRHPAAPLYHLSLACNHCGSAPCADACPAQTIKRDEVTGAVLIEEKGCIGCRYCSWACPYEAPRFSEAHGVMTKCTFCAHRLAEGREPACVSLCPTGALGTTPAVDGRGASVVPGFHADGHEPRIRFVPLRRGFRAPEMTSGLADPGIAAEPARRAPGAGRRISLRGEWPLVGFTLAASGLVGWVAAAMQCGISVSATVFPALAAGAMAASAAHLGQAGRSWRAVLNLRRSWLSREVVLYGLFVLVSLVWLRGTPGLQFAGWAAVAAGVALLFAVDRVYDVAGKEMSAHLHSAGALWMSLYLASVLSGSAAAVAVVGAAKCGLYLARKGRMRKRGRRWRPALSAARVALGLLVPAASIVIWAEAAWAAALGLAVVGEALDRIEYYLELRIETPRAWMEAALPADDSRHDLGVHWVRSNHEP